MRVTELANRADVPDHIVRFYPKSGLLKPMRDPANQNGKYAEADV